jgi:hypothetical protein
LFVHSSLSLLSGSFIPFTASPTRTSSLRAVSVYFFPIISFALSLYCIIYPSHVFISPYVLFRRNLVYTSSPKLMRGLLCFLESFHTTLQYSKHPYLPYLVRVMLRGGLVCALWTRRGTHSEFYPPGEFRTLQQIIFENW